MTWYDPALASRTIKALDGAIAEKDAEIERLLAALAPFVDFAKLMRATRAGWYHRDFYWYVGGVDGGVTMTMAPFIEAADAVEQGVQDAK